MNEGGDETGLTDTAEREARARIGGLFDAAPQAAVTPAPSTTAAARAKRGLMRWVRTATITFGVMYLLGWGVAVGGVAALTGRFWFPGLTTNLPERLAAIVPALQYRLPADPGISPDRAGVAMALLGPEPTTRAQGFEYRDVGERPSAPWRAIPLPPGLFATDGSTGGGLPRASDVLPAVRRPLNATQRQALRLIGTAPVWKEYDLIARAGAADVVGGRLKLPFAADAHWAFMPTPGSAASVELAIAGVSRAAWHLSEGRSDSAEAVLRGIISVGAVMVENSPLIVEQIAGARVVTYGRDALIQFYELRGDPRGPALRDATAAASQNYRNPFPPVVRGNIEATRHALVTIAGSNDAPRSLRFETLPRLNYSSCGRFRDVAFGGDDVPRTVAADLRVNVARFESERAVVDLLARSIDEPVGDDLVRETPNGAQTLLLVSRIYFNPRIANCMLGPYASYRRGS